MKADSLLRGLIDGLSFSVTALHPKEAETQIEPKIFTSSYRPPENDCTNLEKDFKKVIQRVEKDIKYANEDLDR